jgi:hypothetical protein
MIQNTAIDRVDRQPHSRGEEVAAGKRCGGDGQLHACLISSSVPNKGGRGVERLLLFREPNPGGPHTRFLGATPRL